MSFLEGYRIYRDILFYIMGGHAYMYKRTSIFIYGLVLILGLTATAYVKADSYKEAKRLGGSDRYATCAEIVKEGWANCDYAVIVNGENFPDALSASTLAKKYNAPILLTQSNTLDDNALNQLKRLNVKNVFIVGGTYVVNKSVEKAIKNLGIQTTRYSGQDRNETSIKVAEQIGTGNGIIIAIDNDYTDALSAAPIAGTLNMPIILVPKDKVPASVKNFIKEETIPKTYVLGDSDIIDDSVATQFPNVQRITGADKYERNINIINTFADKLNLGSACLAYSEKFADALSGSALAALDANPVILVGDKPTTVTANFVKSRYFKRLNVLGGEAGIKQSTLLELNDSNIESNNSKIVFKDINFEQVIREKINKPKGDLYAADVKDITSIILGIQTPNDGWKEVKDISGIENLSNLFELNLDGNRVADISSLKGLTKLKWLRLYSSGVSDISSLKELTNLYELELSDNKISDINILKNLPNLKRLGLGSNKISDISVLSSLTNLTYLDLYGDKINDISVLEKLTNLNDLELGENQISDINVLKGMTNLEFLNLGNNQISDITALKGLTKLIRLDLTGNPISDNDKAELKKALPNCDITF